MQDYLLRLWKDIDGDHVSVRARNPHDLSYFRNFLVFSKFLEVMNVTPFCRSLDWLERPKSYGTDALHVHPRSYIHYQYRHHQHRHHQNYHHQHYDLSCNQPDHTNSVEYAPSSEYTHPPQQDTHTEPHQLDSHDANLNYNADDPNT